MKAILTTLLLFSISAQTYAQSPDKALSRVSYNFVHVRDTNQKDRPHKENMLLVVGKNASVYTSYDKINQQLKLVKQLEEQKRNQSGSTNMSFNISSSGNGPTSPTDYFYFASENKFFTKERVFNAYLIEEAPTKIDWKITKDTASISGIPCQKAEATFKGRNWIAWYATELPFQSGPWKLNGLPGLIIQAYDQTKTVQFLFAGMENVAPNDGTTSSDPMDPKLAPGSPASNIFGALSDQYNYLGNEIKLPTDAIKATRKELDKLKEARDKDPQGFMKTQIAGAGMGIISVTGRAMPPGTGPVLPKIELNNPLELPEKQ